MGLSNNSSRTPRKFVKIIGGKLVINVPEGTEGAVSRVNKNGKEVFELKFDDLSGKITSLSLEETDLGPNYNITFSDNGEEFILSLGVDSAYGDSFVERVKNIDFSKIVVVEPYDFEADGKRRTGLAIYNKESEFDKKVKVEKYFTKENSEGVLPEFPKKGKKGYDLDELKVYRIQLRKVYKRIIEEISEQFGGSSNNSNESETVSEPESDDLPF